MPDAAAVLRHKRAVAYVESVDRVALLDLDRPGAPPLMLTGSGVAIWEAVDGHRSVDAVVRAVAADYDVPPAAVAPDVLAYLDELVTRGLLTAG